FILRDIYPCIWLALFGGLVLGFISSALIGYFSVKLDEIYFAMLTLGFGMMFFTLVHQWRSFTGGSDGISGFPMPVLTLFIKKFELSNPRIYYYFSLFITTIASYILYRIIKSPFGLILLSIKENSERVSFTGINVRFYRWLSFVFAGTFAGLAGSLFSVFDRIASPTMLHWTKSAEPVLMTILGGANIFFGPFLGAAVFFFLEDIITKYTQSWMIFLGFILLFLVILFPEGILGSIIKFLKKEDNER
ncbi:MAG: branched-chain amino acid ABC transporter permease, partial [Deltaproteobacteria bacterium]|nr:branched-chain amino acid ABC transporter permease [Deltaproteobacteria bacterium]